MFSRIWKQITNLLLKQKCKERRFQLTTSAWGEGTEGRNNTNHVIKYFPRKTTGIGRGGGRGGGKGKGGGGMAKIKILNREF